MLLKHVIKSSILISSSGIGLIVVGLLAIGEFRTWQVQNSGQQKVFLAGRLPATAPNGFYAGSVPGISNSSWQGKRFDSATASGINIFLEKGSAIAQYPFKTAIGRGARDPEKMVFQIKYDNPKNPWWVRIFLDEVVEVKPNLFLGKLNIKLIPGRPYQITFFELRKDSSKYKLGPQ
jgi:hypothetical protein